MASLCHHRVAALRVGPKGHPILQGKGGSETVANHLGGGEIPELHLQVLRGASQDGQSEIRLGPSLEDPFWGSGGTG